MENLIVISPRIISRIKNMPVEERKVMLDTLFCEEILGVERSVKLTPLQELVYMMFRNNILNESKQFENNQSQALVS
ncbi:MAG: hypothetical protein KBT09_00460 [Bacteroidales bacterium]|nr:hypothetical protein [Candidatus Sodaliphilus fimicaballi]